jgi:thiamine pyrophosphokinase
LRAIIVANSILDNPARLSARLADWGQARVFAADGGLENCRLLGLTPEAVIGDLDSIEPSRAQELEHSQIELRRSPARKDETDLELALLHVRGLGVDGVIVLGAWGGRLDMSAANLLLLAHPGLSGMDLQLWTSDQSAWLIRPPGAPILGRAGELVSLIPLTAEAQGVTTAGLEYPLHGETLTFGVPRGVSNVLAGPRAEVGLGSGLLLAVHSHGPTAGGTQP